MAGTDSSNHNDTEQAAAAWEARSIVARLAFGQMAAQTLGVAARMGIFERIGAGERTADDLARDLGTQPQATHRLLRALAGLQLLTETAPGTFATTPAGDLLRPDVPGTMLALARLFTRPLLQGGWDLLEEGIRTGRTTFDTAYGTDFFSYLKDRPELSAEFNAAMSQATRYVADVLPRHYDFGRFGTVVDVGGGDGTLLAGILRAHPGLRGILYDTAEGLAQAPERFAREGLTGRVTLETGDFFASAPPGGDLYLLKSVIHDWDDERCTTILRHIRKVVPVGGTLLIAEPVLPPTVPAGEPDLTYLSDLNMLVTVGGRERTADDFAALCAAAGFRVSSLTPVPPQNVFHLIEAVPVPD
ncbi:methyltransferase [Streptosporangium nondiastaticum]|uniref:Methyltransferase n=1 Tax=Streptosporangium nondiastaticum TaxID=35764 RepID=A0A9X7PE75_9ACTN|nr:methyltransferase [Streptosporangium nondiastaticum]PSJ24638.1 methyltransferase [Streptosporangium nondiastaticum]